MRDIYKEYSWIDSLIGDKIVDLVKTELRWYPRAHRKQ